MDVGEIFLLIVNIHLNPLAADWQLAKASSDYYFSSASVYAKNEIQFPYLKDMRIEMIK